VTQMKLTCPWCCERVDVPHSVERCPLCSQPVVIRMDDYEEGPVFFLYRAAQEPGKRDFKDATYPGDDVARAAYEIQMRRGWHVEQFSLLGGGYAWRIPMSLANDMIRRHGAAAAEFKVFASLAKWSDPFTALVEADKWYTSTVERT
jgi:hypothetical protein